VGFVVVKVALGCFLSAVLLHQFSCAFIHVSEHLRLTQYGISAVTVASYCCSGSIFGYYWPRSIAVGCNLSLFVINNYRRECELQLGRWHS